MRALLRLSDELEGPSLCNTNDQTNGLVTRSRPHIESKLEPKLKNKISSLSDLQFRDERETLYELGIYLQGWRNIFKNKEDYIKIRDEFTSNPFQGMPKLKLSLPDESSRDG